jgi:hypothetical protein
VTALVPLEVVELEERLHDEVLCEVEADLHDAVPCGVVARFRVSTTCPYSGRPLHVCRPYGEWLRDLWLTCSTCGKPVAECWVVTAL